MDSVCRESLHLHTRTCTLPQHCLNSIPPNTSTALFSSTKQLTCSILSNTRLSCTHWWSLPVGQLMVWVRMRDDRAEECCWEEGLWAPHVSPPAGEGGEPCVSPTKTDISQLNPHRTVPQTNEILNYVVGWKWFTCILYILFVNISGMKYIPLSEEDIKLLCPNCLQFYFWLTDGPNDTTIDMFSASGNKRSNEIFNFLNIFCLLGKSELI